MSLKSLISNGFNSAISFCFLQPDGKISITKTCANTAAACAAILAAPITVPAMLTTIGIPGVIIVLPVIVAKAATVIGGISLYIAGMRVKNTADKNKEAIAEIK